MNVMEQFFSDTLSVRKQEFEGNITMAEQFMSELPQLHVEPIHRFAEGLYCRQLDMPKDTVWISRVHKHENYAFIMTGSCTVVSEHGKELIQAPFMMKTFTGTKRLLLIHEDCTWFTVHAVPPGLGEDVEQVEEYLACNTLQEFQDYLKNDVKEVTS